MVFVNTPVTKFLYTYLTENFSPQSLGITVNPRGARQNGTVFMKKKIIAAILCILMILGSTLSLSSCLYALGSLVDIPMGSGEDDPTQSGSGGQDGTQDGGSGDLPSQNGGAQSGVAEFLPGFGDEDMPVENVTSSARALLSVVSIISYFEKYAANDFGFSSGNETREYTSRGSGVIYKLDREKGDAYVITNFHVVFDKSSIAKGGISNKIQLFLYGQEGAPYAIPATYVGGSMQNDIAVLKVQDSEVLRRSYALAATVGDSDTLSVMDSVVAIGNPEGQGISATSGIVSVDSETLVMIGADGSTTISPRVIRVSAAINEGNSGGGLFDSEGKLVGIVNAKKTGSEIDNIAYAIPVIVATGIAENIIGFCDGSQNTTFYKCMLGIQLTANVTGLVIDPESGKIERAELVEVAELTSSCITGDLVRVGDVITAISVDGVSREVTRLHHVIDHMLRARVGSTVVLTLQRGDETLTATVTITQSAWTAVK